MRLCNRVLLLGFFFLALVSPVLAQGERTATITLGRDPEPPFCVANPGGVVDIFWDIQHQTTPRYVYYKLEDPTRTIILEQQTYPNNTGIHIFRQWTVPNGMVDGKYWVRVEYWSYETGNEANAEVTFYICAESGNLCVQKYKDANCNGQLDPDDPPLAGWWVCIDTPEGDTICELTDASGQHCWSGIPLGNYHVYEYGQDGWLPVGPDSYDVNLPPGQVTTIQFLNVKYDECFGACCLRDGSCVEVGEQACAEQGGTFHGYGSTCAGVSCPQPEACCFVDGHCEFLLPLLCQAAGGTPQGPGTDCDPNHCPQPTGACCFPDGHCVVETQAACDAAGGTYYGNFTDCDPNPCTQPLEACCFPDGHCEDLTAERCIAAGGTPQGYGSDCDPNQCPQPPMACCFPDGHCAFVTAEECYAMGGTPQGYGTNCDPNLCPQPPQACCFPDGHCEDLTAERCYAAGGTPQGYGTDCDPNLCPQPPQACCFADGHCEFVTAEQCAAMGGTPQGYGTDCDPNLCPPPPPPDGACCFPDGSCRVMTEEDCAAAGGTTWIQGEDCDPNPCPPTATKNTTWGQIKADYR